MEENMKDFIRNELVNIRNKNIKTFDCQYVSDNGNTISMIGNVKNGMADFEITRTKANGHKCSGIPVFQMPLSDELINKSAEIAVKNL